jgi:hypothetical protein
MCILDVQIFGANWLLLQVTQRTETKHIILVLIPIKYKRLITSNTIGK